jgi:hypothetical protein
MRDVEVLDVTGQGFVRRALRLTRRIGQRGSEREQHGKRKRPDGVGLCPALRRWLGLVAVHAAIR